MVEHAGKDLFFIDQVGIKPSSSAPAKDPAKDASRPLITKKAVPSWYANLEKGQERTIKDVSGELTFVDMLVSRPLYVTRMVDIKVLRIFLLFIVANHELGVF